MIVEESDQKPKPEEPRRPPSTYEKVTGIIARGFIIAILASVIFSLLKGCV